MENFTKKTIDERFNNGTCIIDNDDEDFINFSISEFIEKRKKSVLDIQKELSKKLKK